MAQGFILSELAWPDVEAYLNKDDRLILVAGSTEQHGRHMALGTDLLIPTALGQALCERTSVLMAPPLPFGFALYHMGFPGTFNLQPGTLLQVWRDILGSAYRHGFRRLYILNGHGGNAAPVRLALQKATDRHKGLRAKLRDWWLDPIVEDELRKRFPEHREIHATIGETAVMMHFHPDLVRAENAQHTVPEQEPEFISYRELRARFPAGVIGSDPKLATPELGKSLVDLVLDKYLQELTAWRDE